MRIARESYERINEVEPVRTRKIESIIISILSTGALFGILAAIIILIISMVPSLLLACSWLAF